MLQRMIPMLFGVVMTFTLGARGEVAFRPAQSFPVGVNPIGLAVGDFNGDGKRDVAVLNDGDASSNVTPSVSILLGNGNGTFQAAKNFTAQTNFSTFAVGDFNADGKDDLAIARFPAANNPADNGNVTILLSNGDGTFRAASILTPGANPDGILVSDFNGDHKLDLAITDGGPSGSRVSVLLGNGDGTFQPPSNFGQGVIGISLGDFNGDGRVDLVTGGGSGVSLWKGNGDGTFQAGVTAITYPVLLGVADFNGDGKLDLLARAHMSCRGLRCSFGPVGVFLGNGDGTFQAALPVPGEFVGVAGDLNGDGKIDLAGFTPNGSGHDIAIFQGNGNGTFKAPLTLTAGTEPIVGAVVDLNGDNKPDLLTVDLATTPAGEHGTISVLLNDTGAEFSISASTPSPETLNTGQSAVSTVDLTLQNRFSAPVSLSCAVQPTGVGAPTCSVSPSSVKFDSKGKATATLTISSNSAVASLMPPTSWARNAFAASSLLLVGLAFTGAWGKAKPRQARRRLMLTGAILLTGLVLQLGCGGASGNTKTRGYIITITGKSQATQQTAAVNITLR